jgi:hypothetical protein
MQGKVVAPPQTPSSASRIRMSGPAGPKPRDLANGLSRRRLDWGAGAKPLALGLLAATLLTATPAFAADTARPLPPGLDQEMWAGISYGDALLGLALLSGGTVALAWATGSTATALTVAAAAAITFVVYDPGPVPPAGTPSEALPELAPGGKN